MTTLNPKFEGYLDQRNARLVDAIRIGGVSILAMYPIAE